ncbi:unnamed protein product [Kuraishia capsulata CBS 1993]|uniref:Major facilitator superfamily (MFS) profile domain-containing protein n=1 Tax=Kuraishia capsulata CBS 1993 TaxID=1382522 RepID=W6MU80_9ASCO|nr:uncharacterized protein KUCA_T00004938001 [Kuraishia capsulata CBS 1993]CDK28952.1 unnamed protein product [Kuraishia capsulata CBS 1993]
MEKLAEWGASALDHAGVNTAWNAPRDIHTLFLLRMIRLYGYSGVSLILAYYLTQVGIDTAIVGFYMTCFLLGDMVVSFLLSAKADSFGRAHTHMIGSGVMAITGLIFAFSSNPTVLLVTGIVGFITPGGGEVGPFRNVEFASIANLSTLDERSDYYTWYSLLGIMAFAIGSIINGWTMTILIKHFGWTKQEACKSVFLVQCLTSLLCMWTATKLSSRIEVAFSRPRSHALDSSGSLISDDEDENSESLRISDPKEPPASSMLFGSKNFWTVIRISFFYTVDAFSKSMVTDGWVSFYLIQKFSADPAQLGVIFFMANALSAVLSVVGTALCKKYGPLVSLIITHVPSTILVMFVPMPETLLLTVIILLLRGAFKAMDMGSKNVFVSAVVPPEERSGAIAWSNMARTVGQGLAPPITGFLTGIGYQWTTFVASGLLRFFVYELGMVLSFWAIRHELEEKKR